jgi:hypothetical protein
MSRFLTLEEYLERFVEENTRSTGDDITLIVTDQQAQTLGFFILNGLAGVIEGARLDRNSSATEGDEESDFVDDSNPNDFIN